MDKSAFKRGLLHILSRFVSGSRDLSLHAREGIPVRDSSRARVLVIMLTHLGDVVINLFVLDAIAAAAGCFDIVMKPPLDQLVRSHPGARRVTAFGCPWVGAGRWRDGVVEWIEILRKLRRNEYDLAVVTHPHELSSLTARLSGSKATAGWAYSGDFFLDLPLYAPQYRDMDQHASKYGLQLLEFLGIPTAAKPEQFPVCTEDFKRGKSLAKKISPDMPQSESKTVVIHLGAGGRMRIWPKDNFIAVIARLLAFRLNVVLIGSGEFEKTMCTEIEKAFPPTGRLQNLCGHLNIGELSGVISAADIFIGHDSGPSHIAGALGVKSCVIFGPSDPAVWGPRGPGVKILHFKDGEFRSPESVSSVMAIIEGLMAVEPAEIIA